MIGRAASGRSSATPVGALKANRGLALATTGHISPKLPRDRPADAQNVGEAAAQGRSSVHAGCGGGGDAALCGSERQIADDGVGWNAKRRGLVDPFAAHRLGLGVRHHRGHFRAREGVGSSFHSSRAWAAPSSSIAAYFTR
ncbi:MAG: hypothetical protein ACJA1L_001343 [Paracoccaceae bacterium]|jgi:hypothetical protein